MAGLLLAPKHRAMLAPMSGDDDVPEAVQEGRELLDNFYGFSREDDPRPVRAAKRVPAGCLQNHRVPDSTCHRGAGAVFRVREVDHSPGPWHVHVQGELQFVKGLEALPLLDLAARLHVLSTLGYKELVKLNTIRNKCAHHWQLHSFSVKQMIRAEETTEEIVPEIPFNGRNLLTPEVMKDEFLPLYGGLYVELWAVQSGVDHPRLYTDETLEAVEPKGDHEG